MTSDVMKLIRADVWERCRDDFESEKYDEAIREAFSYVEAVIQERIGSTAIGGQLINEAFDSRKIDLPGDERDLGSISNLMKGSIGYYRGDRSHGMTPSLPVRSSEKCLRLLVAASSLLDLLDADRNIQPTILSYNVKDGTVDLNCRNVTASTVCFIDDQSAQIISRVGDNLNVSLDGTTPGDHMIWLNDRGQDGDQVRFRLMPDKSDDPRDSNWYRVFASGLQIFTDATGRTAIDYAKAVILEVSEGGHRAFRCFPTSRDYVVGDYVSWDWDLTSVISVPCWIHNLNGGIDYAWTSSAYFAGVSSSPRDVVMTGLRVPGENTIDLRPNMKLPFSVETIYSDGIGHWTERLRPNQPTINVENEAVVSIGRNGALVTKAFGSTSVTATFKQKHVRGVVNVVATPIGATYELLTGYPAASGVAHISRGIAFAHRTSDIERVDNGTVTNIARLSLSRFTAGGIDNIAANDRDDLFARVPFESSRVVCFEADDYSRIYDIELDAGRTAMGLVGFDDGVLIADNKGTIWFANSSNHGGVKFVDCWEEESAFMSLTQIATDGSTVYALDNVSRLHVIDARTKLVETRELPPGHSFSTLNHASGVCYLSDFHTGELYALDSSYSLKKIADGLGTPSAACIDGDGNLVVADLSGGRFIGVFLN